MAMSASNLPRFLSTPHMPLPPPHMIDVLLRKSLLSDAPSSGSSQPASVKPQGLATAGRNPPVINTVIEDFDYQGRDTGTGSSDDEDEADDLEYPGDVAESLVRLTHLASCYTFLTRH